MQQNITNHYVDAIKQIKQAILSSRYRAAALVNREMLSLYFGIGGYISANSRKGSWGTNAIEVISEQLQKELPGLRGFSATNMRNMRFFFEAWFNEFSSFSNRSSIMDEFHQLSTDDLQIYENMCVINHQLLTDDFPLQHFLKVGFTHHCEIMYNVKSREERIFYIQKCATEFWSVEKLKYNLKANLYAQQGTIVSNFAKTISDKDLRVAALRSFVEFAFRDFTKPMGVATYKTTAELPEKYRDILPAPEILKTLLK